MKKKYDIHPDFCKYNISFPFTPAFLMMAAPLQKFMLHMVPLPAGITSRQFTVAGYRNLKVPVEIYEPANSPSALPCLLYFHGGGFGLKGAPCHKQLAILYAHKANCRVVFPDYHLLPQYPYPAAEQDALSVYLWLLQNAENLRIDPLRIAVGGDSAGAALAACLCEPVSSRNLPLPCFQLLVYPVADALQQSASMRRFTDTPMWNAKKNSNMWSMYLKNTNASQKIAASPMQAPLPPVIPDTYLETAEFDCLHDEGIAYAKKLRNAGGNVSVHETRRTIHGYDIVLHNPITRDSIRKRVNALRTAFSPKT